MSDIPGDEWMYAPSPNATKPVLTRAQEQARVDAAYASGKMGLHEWRAYTDELSEPTRWAAKGKRIPAVALGPRP